MKNSAFTVLFFTLAAWPASTAASSDFTVGRWTGTAALDSTLKFDHCSATALDQKNTMVSLTVDRTGAWAMILSNAKWHLPPNHHYPLRISMDGSPALDRDSIAISATSLKLSFGQDQTLLTLVRRGHVIDVVSDGFNQTYNLADSAAVVDQLGNCRRTALATETQQAVPPQTSNGAGVFLAAIIAAPYLIPILPALAFAPFNGAQVTGSTEIVWLPSASAASPRPAVAVASISPPPPPSTYIEVPVTEGFGTFQVPVLINGVLTLAFTIDSGASDVTIPADVVRTLQRAGTISNGDFIGSQQYQLADGSTETEQLVRLHTIKVGPSQFDDLTASVAPEAGTLLLGQGFLKRFASWSIDNERKVLVLQPRRVDAPSSRAIGIPNIADDRLVGGSSDQSVLDKEAAAAKTAAEAAAAAAAAAASDLGM